MKLIYRAAALLLAAAAAVLAAGCRKDDNKDKDKDQEKDPNGETATMTRETLNFNTEWLYSPADYKNGASADLDDSGFEKVSLPHANTLLTDHKGPGFASQIESYRFVSWYRRHFTLGEEYNGRRVTVEFEGVATVADVYVNGTAVGSHKGAYTGFTVDITDALRDGDNVIAVRVDSERQPDIPPEGGPVDYCVFGGIVRDVKMTITSDTYISDVFVTTDDLTADKGTVRVRAEVVNGSKEEKTLTVTSVVRSADGEETATLTGTATVAAGGSGTVTAEAEVASLHLWSTSDPYLYTVTTSVSDGSASYDAVETKFGMRYFSFEEDGFYLNGERTEIVGVNRHEMWPWIGRAANDKQQRADADLIKETGFNAVRCSHYPQDPSFLERCDEIGLIVFEEAPGWQHIGGEDWQDIYTENVREMIIRDKNHPSIVSWGTRVNESFDNDALYEKTNELAKSLDPTRPTHGVRRMESYADSHFLDEEDIFAVNYTYPDKPNHTPFIITEHSMDWYSGHGFSWASDADALAFTKSFAEVVDYYFGNEYCAGGFAWSMFDYNNEVNYTNTDNVFYSGLYDIFRIPKMPSYFYRSQKDPASDPNVYIANYNTPSSPGTVTVFSNCEEVELFVDGKSVGRIKPNLYPNLPHPAYEFKNVRGSSCGELYAVGYIGGKEAASYTVTSPGAPVSLVLEPQSGSLIADGSDFVSVAVYAVDENGNVVPYAENEVKTELSGHGRFIGEETISLEGGSAAFFIASEYGAEGKITATVSSPGLGSASCEISLTAFTEKTVPAGKQSGTEAPEVETFLDVNDSASGTIPNHFSYTGSGWTNGPQTGCYYLDNHYSNRAGDSVTLSFDGERLIWYGTTAPGHGILSISIDGGDPVEIDCYSEERCESIPLYDTGVLGSGAHTVKVTVTGKKNASATDTYVNVDRVRIYGAAETSQKTYSFPTDTVKSGGRANTGSTYEWWSDTAPLLFYVDTIDAKSLRALTIRFGYELGQATLSVYAYDNGGKPLTSAELAKLARDIGSLGDPVASVDMNAGVRWSYGTVRFDADGVAFAENSESFKIEGKQALDVSSAPGNAALLVVITGSIGTGTYFDYIVTE